MKSNKFTLEHFLFFLIFLLALGYRLIGLGQALLSDREAALALQALEVASGKNPTLGSHVLYTLLTSVLFFMFGSSEYLARFWPALAGSLLVFAPLLFKPYLTHRVRSFAATVLAILLALEPGLVAASRTADSRILAVTTSVMAAGFLVNRRYAVGGMMIGLALLCGPYLWPGLIALLIALVWNGKPKLNDLIVKADPVELPPVSPAATLKNLVVWIIGTVLFAGSLFFTVPAGLSGMVTSLSDYLASWLQPSQLSPIHLVIALVVYQPLGLVLSLAVLFWNWRRKDRLDAFLWKWWLAALLLAYANPGIVTLDLLWSLLPLAAMAARQIVRIFHPIPGETWSLAGQTGITVLLLLFAGYNIIGITNPPIPTQTNDPVVRLAIFGGSVLLLLLISLLVAWGWSSSVAGAGLVWGACIILAFYTLSGSWSAAGLGRNPESDLWRNGTYPEEGALLHNTIADFSRWHIGWPEVLDVTVMNVESPALRWLLRGQRQVNYVSFLPPTARPALLITPDQKQVNLASTYSGQDFVWSQAPAWDLIAPSEWIRWVFFREAPLDKRTVVLWVRSDLFPATPKTSQGQYE